MEKYDTAVLKYLFYHPSVRIEQLANSLGIYPEYVINTANNLVEKKYLSNQSDLLSLTQYGYLKISTYPFSLLSCLDLTTVTNRFCAITRQLPYEHPLQYQYWFDNITCKKILEITVDMLSVQRPRLAFIGTPLLSLYFHLAFPDWPITVIDVSETILNYLKPFFHNNAKIILADVKSDPVPHDLGRYDAVLIDPPFYADYYGGFLRWAASMQDDGGLLFTVLFGTSIKENNMERKIVMDLISEQYVFIKSYDNLLKYLVPRFESQTYDNRHLDGIYISDWRQNTLGVFSKCGVNTSELPYVDEGKWVEYVFGRKRIMVKKCSCESTNTFVFHPLYDDSPVMKSVSRRNPDRQAVSLWTSDNEVYTASNSALQFIHEVLHKIETTQEIEAIAIQDWENKCGCVEIQTALWKIRNLTEKQD